MIDQFKYGTFKDGSLGKNWGSVHTTLHRFVLNGFGFRVEIPLKVMLLWLCGNCRSVLQIDLLWGECATSDSGVFTGHIVWNYVQEYVMIGYAFSLLLRFLFVIRIWFLIALSFWINIQLAFNKKSASASLTRSPRVPYSDHSNKGIVPHAIFCAVHTTKEVNKKEYL